MEDDINVIYLPLDGHKKLDEVHEGEGEDGDGVTQQVEQRHAHEYYVGAQALLQIREDGFKISDWWGVVYPDLSGTTVKKNLFLVV